MDLPDSLVLGSWLILRLSSLLPKGCSQQKHAVLPYPLGYRTLNFFHSP